MFKPYPCEGCLVLSMCISVGKCDKFMESMKSITSSDWKQFIDINVKHNKCPICSSNMIEDDDMKICTVCVFKKFNPSKIIIGRK